MGTLLFNRVLNGVLNGISTSTCSIPKRFDSQPCVFVDIYDVNCFPNLLCFMMVTY